MTANVSANIRMYRLNELGDCFLVTFSSGPSTSRMLIDCGSFRNSATSVARLQKITKDIAQEVGGQPLDVVVGTHQHNDHVSGFVHCEQEFRAMGVRQVWLSWLDHPTDPQAQAIGTDHNNLTLQLSAARDELHAMLRRQAPRSVASRSLEVLDDILGFYGANAADTPPELPAKAVRLLKELGAERPLYLEPGSTHDVPGLPAGAVRVHVLGPPRNNALLYRKDPRKGESYDHMLASQVLLATKLLNATKRRRGVTASEERHYPFNQEYKQNGKSRASHSLQETMKRYNRRADAWRTIDEDWLQQAEALSLFLDTFTNNSSLALAIELVKSGKVLLFAADAQTGNWLSWKDVNWQQPGVSTDALLGQTVFYKVGHHASHNATLVETFEKMGNTDLVALIPVHKKDPNITKKNGWKMPATNLFKKLKAKTQHRVLQMDGVNPASCDPTKSPAKASWKKVGIKPKVTNLFVEIEIVG